MNPRSMAEQRAAWHAQAGRNARRIRSCPGQDRQSPQSNADYEPGCRCGVGDGDRRKGVSSGVVDAGAVERTLLESAANGNALDAGRAALVRAMCTSGVRLQLAIAPAAPISQVELPLVEIGTAMVTAKPVGSNFCGVWRTAQAAALQPPGYQQVGA